MTAGARRRPAARPGPRPAREGPTAEVELEVVALGEGGDGIADPDAAGGRRVFVPLALPGERWRARLPPPAGAGGDGPVRAVPLERLRAAPGGRAEPPCPHFGACGGCALQHLPARAYAAFKRGRIEAALARVGLGGRPVLGPAPSPLRGRRRVRLAWRRAGPRRLELGYRGRGGREIVPVAVCPIADPAIEAILPALAAALLPVACLGPEGELRATRTGAGVDLLLDAAGPPGLADLERLAALAEALDLARLALRLPAAAGGLLTVASRRAPRARFGAVEVEVPEGAFLQATAEGEAALQGAVREWVGGARRVVDLFAGLGALTLPLLPGPARLELAEADAAAVAAVAAAGRRARRPEVRAVRRDLERDPLAAGELGAFDAAVLDPPRAGARAQAAELASSPLSRLAYASCHPGSFARDARALEAGGLALREVRAVDQFLFSAEVELVALFARG